MLQIDGLKIETHVKPCQAHEKKLMVLPKLEKHHQELKSFPLNCKKGGESSGTIVVTSWPWLLPPQASQDLQDYLPPPTRLFLGLVIESPMDIAVELFSLFGWDSV